MDVIWGIAQNALAQACFELDVTHRKDSNKEDYAEKEIIIISESDVPGIPRNPPEMFPDIINNVLKGQFLKCEIVKREGKNLHCKVSHSGVGGY